jgi:hypothetical protein
MLSPLSSRIGTPHVSAHTLSMQVRITNRGIVSKSSRLPASSWQTTKRTQTARSHVNAVPVAGILPVAERDTEDA